MGMSSLHKRSRVQSHHCNTFIILNDTWAQQHSQRGKKCMKLVLQTSHNHVLYKSLGVKVGCSFTFLRRLCINVRKTWDTTKPIPTTSRRAEMIPTAGITHDLRVMFACAGYTEIRPRDSRGWMETSISGRSTSFTLQLHDRLISNSQPVIYEFQPFSLHAASFPLFCWEVSSGVDCSSRRAAK